MGIPVEYSHHERTGPASTRSTAPPTRCPWRCRHDYKWAVKEIADEHGVSGAASCPSPCPVSRAAACMCSTACSTSTQQRVLRRSRYAGLPPVTTAKQFLAGILSTLLGVRPHHTSRANSQVRLAGGAAPDHRWWRANRSTLVRVPGIAEPRGGLPLGAAQPRPQRQPTGVSVMLAAGLAGIEEGLRAARGRRVEQDTATVHAVAPELRK